MNPRRVESVDALRGLIMIIMALDHVREFYHAGAMSFQPEDLTRTTTALFFTRWITHFCAPVFMFTAGTGAYFRLARGRTPQDLSRYLWTRGLWLVVLELTVLRLIMNFSFLNGFVLLSILWALGWSMVALGFLIHLPLRALAILSVAMIALHNLADPIRAQQLGAWAPLWNVIHQPGVFALGSINFLAAYPLVPWIGVMAAGFCFGRVMMLEPEERIRWMVRLGLALTVAWIVIRALNVYGDPLPWSTRFPGKTLLSFLRATKYPPSLDFLLMTLGPALLALSVFERLRLAPGNPLLVFGRVPLFYFLGHLLVARLLLIPSTLLRYGSAGMLFEPLPSQGGPPDRFPPDFGFDLWVVYVVWIGVVAMLYPLCRWYAEVKEQRRSWWLSYL